MERKLQKDKLYSNSLIANLKVDKNWIRLSTILDLGGFRENRMARTWILLVRLSTVILSGPVPTSINFKRSADSAALMNDPYPAFRPEKRPTPFPFDTLYFKLSFYFRPFDWPIDARVCEEDGLLMTRRGTKKATYRRGLRTDLLNALRFAAVCLVWKRVDWVWIEWIESGSSVENLFPERILPEYF